MDWSLGFAFCGYQAAHSHEGFVDLAAAVEDPICMQLFVAAAELQQADAAALEAPNHHLAFFLNLYNLTHRLALLQVSQTLDPKPTRR